MPDCAFVHCRENNNLYSLPKSKELRDKWLEQINRLDYTPTVNTRICITHFDENSFESEIDDRGRKRKRKILKEFAYPTLNLTKDEKLKTCHRILTACRKGNAEILELLMQDLSKDDRVEWPKLISEYLFIHHNSLMNSILFQGFNRFSPYHEISKYLQDFAQENGKYRHSSFNAVPL